MSEIFFAQGDHSQNYENQFFVLDFEKYNHNLSNFDKYFFTTFPHDDPTLGDVIYDRVKWINNEMIIVSEYDGLFGFIKSRNDSLGFDSFRFTSKPYYNLNDNVEAILFVFKGKFPSSKGVWPAWWLNGSRQDDWLYKSNVHSLSNEYLDSYSDLGKVYETPSPVNCTDWPSAGEIDIIETINGDDIIFNTIHTCPQMCNSEWNNDGLIINCANAAPSDPNRGCSGKSYKVNSPEGTFACLWKKNSIQFYYWETDIDVRFEGGPLSKSPNPKIWNNSSLKNHVRLFETNDECEEEKHQNWQCETCKSQTNCEFVNLKMIFNITLCGKWAGSEFDKTENSSINCTEYISTEGKDKIDKQYVKIEYLAVSKIQ